jgi:hypothetical protein
MDLKFTEVIIQSVGSTTRLCSEVSDLIVRAEISGDYTPGIGPLCTNDFTNPVFAEPANILLI